jgi:hypothetical protein
MIRLLNVFIILGFVTLIIVNEAGWYSRYKGVQHDVGPSIAQVYAATSENMDRSIPVTDGNQVETGARVVVYIKNAHVEQSARELATGNLYLLSFIGACWIIKLILTRKKNSEPCH